MRLDPRGDPDAWAGRFLLHACCVPALLPCIDWSVRTDLRVNSDWPDLHAEIAPERGRDLRITGEYFQAWQALRCNPGRLWRGSHCGGTKRG